MHIHVKENRIGSQLCHFNMSIFELKHLKLTKEKIISPLDVPNNLDRQICVWKGMYVCICVCGGEREKESPITRDNFFIERFSSTTKQTSNYETSVLSVSQWITLLSFEVLAPYPVFLTSKWHICFNCPICSWISCCELLCVFN